jgi:hypothetical protein
VCVLVVAGVVVSCAQETDDETAAVIEGKTADDYEDAMTWSADHSDTNTFSRDENRCIAEGYVEAIGVEELRDKVSPDEIRDDPESDHHGWGIELDRSQAEDLYRAMRQCADLAPLFEGFAGAFGDDGSADASECLERTADEATVEELMVGTIMDGDDWIPTEAVAGSIYDWLAGCIDFRQLFLSQMDGTTPPEAVTCIESLMDDAFMRRLMIAVMTDDVATQAELEQQFETCGPGAPPILT